MKRRWPGLFCVLAAITLVGACGGRASNKDDFGVYLVRDDGSAAVDGNPTPDADDATQVYVSGNWIFELVAEAVGGALPSVKYPHN